MISSLKNRIKNYFIENNSILDIGKSLRRLKKLDVMPVVFFDVGAYKGDFAHLIMKNWPEAKVYCFEGNPKVIPELEKNMEAFGTNVSVLPFLLGEKDVNDIHFNISETASSILNEHEEQGFSIVKVKMRSLESLISENVVPIPQFLKLDTQGYEYEILVGLGKYISDVEYILLESNFIDIHKNVHLISEIVQFLDKNGFCMYDITEIHRRPLDEAIFQVDFIFVKKNSFLRSDKRWKN